MRYEGTTHGNTDIHTDIHTDIQTYIHTDRQTEPNYYIDAYLRSGSVLNAVLRSRDFQISLFSLGLRDHEKNNHKKKFNSLLLSKFGHVTESQVADIENLSQLVNGKYARRTFD